MTQYDRVDEGMKGKLKRSVKVMGKDECAVGGKQRIFRKDVAKLSRFLLNVPCKNGVSVFRP